jgi:hypothetical protein
MAQFFSSLFSEAAIGAPKAARNFTVKRMENGAFLNDDHLERLLEEILEIRLSAAILPEDDRHLRHCNGLRQVRADDTRVFRESAENGELTILDIPLTHSPKNQ